MKRTQRQIVLFTVVILGFVVFASGRAHAYPQFQLSSGSARCSQCHFAPAGGGLLNSYGRSEGAELSSFRGDGGFLHGAVSLPSWLALGGDLRAAVVDQDVQDPSGPTIAAFPMQADAYARVALPLGLSISGTVGLRGQVREPDVLVPVENYQPTSVSQVISREHYVMLQPEVLGVYLRAGRFFAPFGLRFAEHLLYIRRDLGFDQLRETYNVSAGVIQPSWELHLTAFAPDFIRHIGSDESGVAGYVERRTASDTVAYALQARAASTSGLTRFIGGALAKVYVEPLRTLFLGELDGVQIVFDDPTIGARRQVVGLGGASVFPAPGVMLTLLGERNQIDVNAPAAWTAGTALLEAGSPTRTSSSSSWRARSCRRADSGRTRCSFRFTTTCDESQTGAARVGSVCYLRPLVLYD